MFLLHRKIPGPTVGKAKANSEAGFDNDENIFLSSSHAEALISLFRTTDGSAMIFFLPPNAATGNRTHVDSSDMRRPCLPLDHHYVSARLVCSFTFLLL